MTTRLTTVQNSTGLSSLPIFENQVFKQSADARLQENTGLQDSAETQLESADIIYDAKEAAVKLDENISTPEISRSNIDTSAENKTTTIAISETSPKQPLSRGSSPITPERTTYSNNTIENNNSTAKSSNTSKYGELLSWNQASSLIPRGTTTCKTFNIKRTFGINHINGETSTVSDTNAFKSI